MLRGSQRRPIPNIAKKIAASTEPAMPTPQKPRRYAAAAHGTQLACGW
jgi:hypothetical protein